MHTYELSWVRLRDTPGLQNGNSDHDEVALNAATSAALVLIVLHVNLLIGDMSLLEAMAGGTERTVAKGGRIIYLINRCDELGVDPLVAPEDFLLLKRRKEAELVAALRSRGIQVDPVQVHTLSGDPFGEVGARTDVSRADFSQHRDWDGADSLVRVLDSFSAEQGRAGAAGARLDAALSALLHARVQIGKTLRELRSETEALTSLLQSVENSEQDSRLLESSIRERVRRTVDPHASKAREEVHNAGPAEIHKLVSTSNAWWEDGKLQSDIEQVVIDSLRDIEQWARVHSSVIGREMESWSFRATAFKTEDRFAGPQTAEMAVGKWIARAAKEGSKVAKAIAKRDTVYGIGKAIGVKFKPWGAVKAAGRVAKAAPILAAVGVAADGYAMVKDESAKKDREKYRADAANFISRNEADLVSRVLSGDANDGPLPLLQECVCALTEHKSDLELQQSVAMVEIEAQEKLLSGIEHLLAEGENLRHQEGDLE
ncbi:hypothetical protein BFN03_07060 [Rhodococcus sp. WMMA185]|nr:hypothetical protein BFN03_07060 [Rhodococcus sp. WMMA185]